jgi:hypothetical protein
MSRIPESRRNALRRLGIFGFGSSLALAGRGTTFAQAAPLVPEVLTANFVRATSTTWQSRPCVALEFTDEQQARALAAPGGNPPTYAIVHRDFSDGVIEVDIAAELIPGKAPPHVRGFVGLAFHVSADLSTYEAIYLRVTNGRLNEVLPPAPRVDRAIQYVAHPDFHFDVSRQQFPGRYERGADIALGRWHHFRIDVRGSRARALVDGQEALAVEDLRYPGRRGAVGLWVGEGSRGYFHQLSIART